MTTVLGQRQRALPRTQPAPNAAIDHLSPLEAPNELADTCMTFLSISCQTALNLPLTRFDRIYADCSSLPAPTTISRSQRWAG
jgi:hypothetical protein